MLLSFAFLGLILGFLATRCVCHGPDTHLCRKPSWEVHSHSACYRGHLEGQEGCLWGSREAVCPTTLPDGFNYLTDKRTEVWKVKEAWSAQCKSLSISPPLPDSRGCLNTGEDWDRDGTVRRQGRDRGMGGMGGRVITAKLPFGGRPQNKALLKRGLKWASDAPTIFKCLL